MAETEKFDIKKFFSGFISPVTNAKNVQFVVWLVLIVLVGFTIWRAFFMPNQSQSQKFIVYPFSFSHIDYSPSQQQKQEVKKRPWWLPIPFVEGYGFTESDGRTGIGGRAGGRLEF